MCVHTETYMYTRAHIHRCVHTQACVQMNACRDMYTHACVYTDTHRTIHAHMEMCADMHTWGPGCTHRHTHSQTPFSSWLVRHTAYPAATGTSVLMISTSSLCPTLSSPTFWIPLIYKVLLYVSAIRNPFIPQPSVPYKHTTLPNKIHFKFSLSGA